MTEEVLRPVEKCPNSPPPGTEGNLVEEEGRDRGGGAEAFDESCEPRCNRIFSHCRFGLSSSPRRVKVQERGHHSGFLHEE